MTKKIKKKLKIMLCPQINNILINILPETEEPLALLDENIISLMSLVLRQCSERHRW